MFKKKLPKDWITYKNGNYNVYLNLQDGTKFRYNKLDNFIPEFPESFDLKITNQCDCGCKFCHENSTINGCHGDLLNSKFLNNLHPYTEIAIGGGNPLSHPDLIPFLKMCKDKKYVCSMTVNQKHFIENYELVKSLCDDKLIYGLGVSLTNSSDADFINKISTIPTAVIHTIAGIVTIEDLLNLSNHHLKILILGYKKFRRGEKLYETDNKEIDNCIDKLNFALSNITKNNWFDVISFDNLALKQLDVKSLMTDEEWDNFYLGDDGIDGEFTSASMYIDLVEKKFAKNSCSVDRYDLLDNITDMYKYLKEH